LRGKKAYLVPQFRQGGSSGMPPVPATILMSDCFIKLNSNKTKKNLVTHCFRTERLRLVEFELLDLFIPNH
jgi:hypothetical protein